MMGSHLLRRLSAITIALLNLTGAAVFYGTFGEVFVGFTYSVPVTIAAIVAIRLSFCILTHQAMATSGGLRYLFFAGVALIALAPTLLGSGAVSASIVIQLALDTLIVLITAALRASSQRASDSASHSTYIIPDRAIALDDVFESYGVEELGAFFLYLPKPLQPGDLKARAWIDILYDSELIKSCFRVSANYATKAARTAQPHLFNRNVAAFDVYRLDRDQLKMTVKA